MDGVVVAILLALVLGTMAYLELCSSLRGS